ncbi:MAG TPA: methyltransferase domain-containing protein [Acidimicrobiales bacterium]|nr:methyltransferase domain-containing protein [Acidimicrobiales bacterium]
MNENHAKLCPSPEWAEHIQADVLPFLSSIAEFGEKMLELGPGPGAATDWLRRRVRRLSVVENDEVAAKALSGRFRGDNVDVIVGDATRLELGDDAFDSVGSFTMLHHLPTSQLQQRLLSEVHRVLRPGGAFVGSDSLASAGLHEFHEGDTYNPMDPASFLVRLQAVGFVRITLVVDDILKFVAHKPDLRDTLTNDHDSTRKDLS